ncbi:MAG: response regulator [Jaaginema sp. PMC 1079.18]|nr:response regulator [Jaaginema sp. PMC 1080.18]MEC4850039.1 response regulator [Jaaginema sp. PMC 1079.18]MEC4865139.1 response regulator [Jaaginema sp. PMC 1078.18]
MSDAMPFILIVDDNSTNLSVLSKALKLDGYKIRMAMDGEDALAQVERHPPELILLDVEMPKMDGFETCRRLQANPETQGIPVIFTTALSDTENKVKGLSLGAVDYITKPFQQEEVLARVKVHWRLKQLTDTLEQQVTERTQALQKAQLQLIQQEKLSALGQLVAGVAHEINNPVGFVGSNITAAQEYVQDLLAALALYAKHTTPPEDVVKALADLDLEFIAEDFPKLMTSMQIGCDRIRKISTSLRTFSRTDTDRKTAFNLHEGIDSSLLILKYRLKANEFRPAIEIHKYYGDIPEINCFPGQINQVFMNLFANAIDAFDENICGKSYSEIEQNPNIISIKTAMVAENQVQILIRDNGCGMESETVERIFEQGFTTKGVGKGTGLGMAIAQQIIAEKHGGEIGVNSQLGEGTEFIIRLPLQG